MRNTAVPELASRKHIEMILPVVDEALNKAKLRLRTYQLLLSVRTRL